MFIISNLKLTYYTNRIKEYYIKADKHVFVEVSQSYLYLFEGYLYHDTNYTKQDILAYFIDGTISKDFKQFKGKYCGVFIDLDNNSIYFFNDKLGIRDLYYYFKNGEFIISNMFSEIMRQKKFNRDNIDLEALNEFLIFEYPLMDKTFIEDIKLLPLSSIYKIEEGMLSKFNYWKYQLVEDINFDEKNAVEKLDFLFKQSILRIKKEYGENKIYGLGLSGGLDSRLVAYYGLHNNMRIKTFVFGETNSDAYNIAKKVAAQLNLEHHEVGVDINFIKYADECIKFNPMMNILYAWYYSTYNNLPKFDFLLTGFNGDNQFGSHLITDESISNEKLLIKLIKNYGLKNRNLIKLNEAKIIDFLNSADQSTENKWENFNYQFRQLKFIKNNPAFNFLGHYDGISIFEDIDLVDYLLSVPFSWKYDLKFYHLFFNKKITQLSHIRCERESGFHNKYLKYIDIICRYIDTEIFKTNIIYKKSHKNIGQWLKGNKLFYEYCHSILKIDCEFFVKNCSYLNMEEELSSIFSGKSKNLHLFFRLLTIKLFMINFIDDMYVED